MTSEETPLYHRVKAHPTARIAPSAGIVGDVTIGRDASVFAGVQIRGDDAPVVIGDESNLQENTVVHVDFDVPCIVGPHCTVGHGTILHGCELGENVLVGMGSIVMTRPRAAAYSLGGGWSLETVEQTAPRGGLSMGTPAPVKRAWAAEEMGSMCASPADMYGRHSGEMLGQGVLEHPAPDMDMHRGA